MENTAAKKLLEKYILGKADPQEQAIVEKWYADISVKDQSGLTSKQKEDQLEYIRKALPADETKQIKLWPRIAAAASIILVLAAGLLYTYQKQSSTIHYANDIKPGKNGATLILGNGQKIVLSDAVNGELANESGVLITKASNGELVYEIKGQTAGGPDKINTLTTAKGETYRVKLPDGTIIWLNSASSLKYPASFAALKSRKVELSGEAYFEVYKDKAHPFIVKTDQQEVQVLGTHFNINSYGDDVPVKTTLLEGSIRISAKNTSEILKPGQQAILSNQHDLKVIETDAELAIAWKNNEFLFESESIENIMKMVERWYNVEVIYTGEKPVEKIVGGVPRSENVSKLLQIIESSGGAHFKIDGRKIYVSK